MRRALLLVLTFLCSFGTLLALADAASAQTSSSEDVHGVFRNNGDPVAGVDVSVTSDGKDVGSATSDDKGAWKVQLDQAGDFEVKVDVKSFPKGVNLRDASQPSRVVNVRPNESQIVIFALGKDTRRTTSDFDRFLQLLVDGIRFGLVIAMASVGLSLIYGTTGLINFAHAEIVTFGALMAWMFNQLWNMQLILATILAIIVTGVFSGLNDVLLWRPLRKRGTGLVAMMIISIGMSLFVRNLFLYQFGGRTRPYNDYFAQRAVHIGPVDVAPRDIWTIAICVIVLVLVAVLLQRTRMGKATRAVADNPDLAAASGIDVDRVIALVWVVGGGLAALGGVLHGLSEQVSFQTGFQLLLLMFAGITLGGLGTAYGALVGSFVIGMLVQVSTLWISPELKTVPALAVLVLILLVRPQGILGQSERVG